MPLNKIIETKAAIHIIPDWIEQFNKKDMDFDYQDKLHHFDCCLVGDFRGRIGLSRDYLGDDIECCDQCVVYAYKFEKHERKNKSFIKDLEKFLSHMEKVHDWKKDDLKVEKEQEKEIINAISM